MAVASLAQDSKSEVCWRRVGAQLFANPSSQMSAETLRLSHSVWAFVQCTMLTGARMKS